MKYPNAYKGIKKIYVSEILKIVTSVLVVLIMVLLPVLFRGAGSEEVLEGTLLSVIAVSLVSVIGLIIYLIGLQQARKDGQEFRLALIMTVIALALQIAEALLESANPILGEWLDFICEFIELAAFESVVTGIVCFAKELGEEPIVSIGRKMRILVTLIWLAVIAGKMLEFIPGAASESLEVVTAILEAVDHIFYLVLLIKAGKMLADPQ